MAKTALAAARAVDAKTSMLKVAAIGAGYWGKNIVRNLAELGALAAICDHDAATAQKAAAAHNAPARGWDEILADPEIAAVAIAAPAALHGRLARAAIESGKHVFVEKPLALDVAEAAALCDLAEKNGRVLMVGHLLHYHPAFLKLQELARGGTLGKLQYLYSNRLNLGKIRREENILWSFAPHDISMILALVGEEPNAIAADGAHYLQHNVADVTTTTLAFPGGAHAHVFVSWLHPFKEQKLVVVGSEAMAVFDDGEPWASKLKLYRHRIEWRGETPLPQRADAEPVTLAEGEPLRMEMQHFIDCARNGATPRTDGREGLRVLRVLAAASAALKAAGGKTRMADFPGVQIHPTAQVDDNCSIAAGTKIWHFSHVLSRTRIGKDCVLGQNVVAGPDVAIGDDCKIQNNVSVYKGVTLEDGVFCGPSCVFTNVINPRAEVERKSEFKPTLVKRGATIGANATIICGHTIGAYAMIGAGAVVTKDVPDFALMVGNPARRTGWMSRAGAKLGADLVCPLDGSRYREAGGKLTLLESPDARYSSTRPAPIPFIDLKAQRRRLGARIDDAMRRVVDHGGYIMGPEVKELEAKLAAFAGAKHCVSCANGTDALALVLMAHGVGPGDAVFVPAFTFVATAEIVVWLGAMPVFVDVLPDTFNLDPASLAAAIPDAAKRGLKPRAVIPVDLFGQPADYRAILPLAEKHNLFVLDDAAQGFGGRLDNRRIGGFGQATATSFFPAKPLGCYGDGGAVLTDDADLAEIMRSLRVHGQGTDKYDNVRIGMNGRLDTLQAAILLEKLAIFEDEIVARDRVARRYSEALADMVTVPKLIPGANSVWAQYTIQSDKRPAIQAACKEAGVPTMVYYPLALSQQTGYRAYPSAPAGVPVSEALTKRVLSLPMHPYLDEAAQDRVIAAVRGGAR